MALNSGFAAAAPFDIAGRVAIVTGASSGIGRHLAAMLARQGALVGVAARRTDELKALVAEIEADGGRAAAAAMDIADPSSIVAGVDAIEAALGPVSLLVNNAGWAFTKPMLDVSEEEIGRILAINLDGNVALAREVARRLIARGEGGSIINVASILGLKVSRFVSAYSVSKAALIAATQQLAMELGPHGIRVNALAPGYVRTALSEKFFEASAEKVRPRIPLRRFLEVGDLDGPVLLLLSDAGSMITGTTLIADGGHSIVPA